MEDFQILYREYITRILIAIVTMFVIFVALLLINFVHELTLPTVKGITDLGFIISTIVAFYANVTVTQVGSVYYIRIQL